MGLPYCNPCSMSIDGASFELWGACCQSFRATSSYLFVKVRVSNTNDVIHRKRQCGSFRTGDLERVQLAVSDRRSMFPQWWPQWLQCGGECHALVVTVKHTQLGAGVCACMLKVLSPALVSITDRWQAALFACSQLQTTKWFMFMKKVKTNQNRPCFFAESTLWAHTCRCSLTPTRTPRVMSLIFAAH